MTMQAASAARIAGINAIAALHNSGFIRIYTTDSNDPDTNPSATLLAELTFGSTAFATATDDGTNASAVANAIGDDASANASGTAAHFRTFASNGTTLLTKGTVTAVGGGGDMQLNTLTIVATGAVSCSSFTLRQPQG